MQFSRVFSGLLVGIFPESDGDCIKIGIEEIRIRVTFADLCPRIRCSAKTLTPADTAKLAAVCRKSCGVICWTFARFTAPQIRQ